MDSIFWTVIGTSAVVSTVVGGLITGTYALRAKRTEYINDYFKLVIQRRLAAYDGLEALVLRFKSLQITEENQSLHWAVASKKDLSDTFAISIKATKAPMWISPAMMRLTREMNIELNRADNCHEGPASYGIANYENFALLRERIERQHAKDMMTLHHVEPFLKEMQRSALEFETIDIGKRKAQS